VISSGSGTVVNNLARHTVDLQTSRTHCGSTN